MIIFEVMNYLITKWEKLVENLKSWHKVLMAGLQKAPPSPYFRVVRFVIPRTTLNYDKGGAKRNWAPPWVIF